LASFELCLQHGCDGFEFDVRLSSDEKAVICHDALSGGIEIEKMTSRELLLPTLEDVLQRFASCAFLDIELKVVGLEGQTLALLRKYPPQHGFVVSSFLPDVLSVLHDLGAAIPLGLLGDTRRQLRGWRETSAEWVIPQFKLVDEELVRLVHAAGKKIMVWTVNRPEHMREFSQWGVDGIISDESELLVRSLR
jgi:glycerophosphoryl diester phosphodiesterase